MVCLSCKILHYPSKNCVLMLRVCLSGAAFLLFSTAVMSYFWLWVPVSAICCAAGALTALAAVLCPERLCMSRSYLRTKNRIIINSGILRKKTVIIERAQMQCMMLKSSLPERIFGLCSVVFCCSGARYALSGLSVEEASRLRRLFEGKSGDDC